MELDIPHMIASGVIIFGVLWVFNHTSSLKDRINGRTTLFIFVAHFVVLPILNSAWPYGATG